MPRDKNIKVMKHIHVDQFVKLQTQTYGCFGYRLKLTQRLDTRWDFGHYYWAIENKEGHLVCIGYSGGGVPDKVTEKDLKDIFDRWWRDKIQKGGNKS
jgi:hypothetical protein